jgi:hypothetical protein
MDKLDQIKDKGQVCFTLSPDKRRKYCLTCDVQQSCQYDVCEEEEADLLMMETRYGYRPI